MKNVYHFCGFLHIFQRKIHLCGTYKKGINCLGIKATCQISNREKEYAKMQHLLTPNEQ